MKQGGRIRIVVQDADGCSIANARVFIEWGSEPFPDIAALSNDQGEVEISVPSAGVYRVACVATGFATGRQEVESADEEPRTMIVQLRPET